MSSFGQAFLLPYLPPAPQGWAVVREDRLRSFRETASWCMSGIDGSLGMISGGSRDRGNAKGMWGNRGPEESQGHKDTQGKQG
ncbi:hypothetical protein FA13DRAFT_975701 [Coprinellus micaceus]|uniref:Uncharacterized protein n=1 Tax=Coprinellus micaceus TaxID=71717 RepID=A0A4Y7T0N5_COPMI|nr:hypothetical protein FA13DRAFT_975701 [Coprinellus micaceus]